MRDDLDMDQLIGVTRRRAAKILGVLESRLRAWDRSGLLHPSSRAFVKNREVCSYDLEKLVQGLVIRQLEDRGVHIRSIKTIVAAFRGAEHPRPLASLHWGIAGKEVYVRYPDGTWFGHKQPKQSVLVETLDLDELRANARDAATARDGEPGTVEQRRATLGYKPLFAGTRIPVDTVVAYLDAGQSDEQILAAFPLLEPLDIDYARSARIAS